MARMHPGTVRVLLLVFIVTLGSAGCLSGGGGDGAVATSSLSGTLVLRSMIAVPPEARAEVETLRPQLLAAGFRVSRSAEIVVWPDSPAPGYIIDFAGTRTFTDADGKFSIPSGGSGSGTITHPSSPGLTAVFTPDQIARSGGTLAWMLPFESQGMNSTGTTSQRVLGAIELSLAVRASRLPTPTQVTYGPRGSYPNLANPAIIHCEDKNGYLSDPSHSNYIRYLGSTCDLYVRAGACPNENVFSDGQYTVGTLLDLVIDPSDEIIDWISGTGSLVPSQVFGEDIDCEENHKARACQHVLIGDISLDIDSNEQEIITAGQSGEREVCPGESVPFTIHNNGNYGITYFSKPLNQIHGVIDVPGKQYNGEQGRVEHWNENGGEYRTNDVNRRYHADRAATFQVPPSASPGLRDRYEFTVDGNTVTVTFIVCANTGTGDGGTGVETGDGDTTGTGSETTPDLIAMGPPTLSAVHTVGSTECPQTLGSLFVQNLSDSGISFTITCDDPAFELTRYNGDLPANGIIEIGVIFNCSDYPPKSTTVTITATEPGGGTTVKTSTVTLAAGN